MSFFLLATKYCTSSPDTSLCNWVSQGPILTIPEFKIIQMIGIASEFENCDLSKTNQWFQFIPINEQKTMLWIVSTIQSGECPGFYKF